MNLKIRIICDLHAFLIKALFIFALLSISILLHVSVFHYWQWDATLPYSQKV